MREYKKLWIALAVVVIASFAVLGGVGYKGIHWYARSAEFLQTPLMTHIRWSRMFGDTLFAFGALVLGAFVLGLATGHSFDKKRFVNEGELSERDAETLEPQTTSAD